MRAVLFREPGAAGAVEAGPIEVALARVLLGGHEVGEAGALLDLDGSAPPANEGWRIHEPAALGDGAAGPGELAQIEVGKARSLGEPDEAVAVLQEDRGAASTFTQLSERSVSTVRGAPRGAAGESGTARKRSCSSFWARFSQENARSAPVRGEGELGHHVHVVGVERHEALGSGRSVLGEAHHAHPHDGVRVARLRVALGLDLVVHGEEVHDGEGGHPRLVELQVGHRGGVRAHQKARPFRLASSSS